MATRGAGKSSASAVIVEEGFGLGVQTVVFDRTGVYWGLRSNAKGDGPGLPIYVLGGPHGDVPLESHAGVLIADLVVDSGHSFVLDLSDFSKSAAIKFSADFLERLYDRKARARSTTLVVMDEAHFYAPQTPRGGFKGDAARLMGAMEDMVGLGRSRGLGIVLTTQRTQALNKAVLDMIETLLVMRMLSPRARDAVQDWIREKHEDDREGVIATLESLPTGTAWVWSPLRGILEKLALRRIKTFDSYETPTPGQVRVEPQERRELDLDALGEQMKSSVERAKENDPAELRRQIAALRRELAERPTEVEPQEVERVVEVPVLTGKELMEATTLVGRGHDLAKQMDSMAETLRVNAGELAHALVPLAQGVEKIVAKPEHRGKAVLEGPRTPPPAPRPTKPPPKPADAARAVTPPPRPSGGESDGKLPKADRLILQVLVQSPQGRSKRQLATLAGYAEGGGGFNNPLSRLRTSGQVTYGDPIHITDAGRVALGESWEPMPTGPALRDYWIAHNAVRKVSAAPKILRLLCEVYPNAMSKEQIAEQLDYSEGGGGFNNGLSRLRSLELAVTTHEGISASPDLFVDG